jgi:hypothetical protein
MTDHALHADAAEAVARTFSFSICVATPTKKNNVAEHYPEKVKSLRQKLDKFAGQAVPPKGGDSKPANFNAPAVWGDSGG